MNAAYGRHWRLARLNAITAEAELNEFVNQYLQAIGDEGSSCGETYAETAVRLGGNEFLEATQWVESNIKQSIGNRK